MIIIKHRINTINDIKNTDTSLGAEIDLRSCNGKIYLSHDPFKSGTEFSKWLKFFKHKFIVLNVKEEGLEEKIIKILKKNKIKNFFFHDQTFSTMLKNMKKTKVSIRYSEYEKLKKTNYLFKFIKWIWIDHFTKFDLNKKFYLYLKKKKVKICIVSPELVNQKSYNKILKLKNFLKKNNLKIDAICTKYPEKWLNQK
jgi:hypothetical protein